MPAVANRSSDHLVLRAYALAFALALGVTVSNSFARFACALVLPAMRSELHWSYAQAGWLNIANAIDYLIGAIFTRLVIRHTGNRMLFVGGVALPLLLDAAGAAAWPRAWVWMGWAGLAMCCV